MTSTGGHRPASAEPGKRRNVTVVVALACVVALVVGVVAVVGVALSRRGGGANGAGLNYRGTFYHLSSAEVRPDVLGDVLGDDVPFQDTRIQLRQVKGVDADTAVAGFVPAYPGTGTTAAVAWLLLSPDADLAADPWRSAELSGVVLPVVRPTQSG